MKFLEMVLLLSVFSATCVAMEQMEQDDDFENYVVTLHFQYTAARPNENGELAPIGSTEWREAYQQAYIDALEQRNPVAAFSADPFGVPPQGRAFDCVCECTQGRRRVCSRRCNPWVSLCRCYARILGLITRRGNHED